MYSSTSLIVLGSSRSINFFRNWVELHWNWCWNSMNNQAEHFWRRQSMHTQAFKHVIKFMCTPKESLCLKLGEQLTKNRILRSINMFFVIMIMLSLWSTLLTKNDIFIQNGYVLKAAAMSSSDQPHFLYERLENAQEGGELCFEN